MYAAPALRLCMRAAAYIGLALVPFFLLPGIWIDHQSMLPAVRRGCELMILLLLFLQKQSLAFAVYLFGIGTLLTGPGLKKKSTCDNALTMTSLVHW